MRLTLVRHLWGVTEPIERVLPSLASLGFAAIETPICFLDAPALAHLDDERRRHGFGLVVQDFTCMWERNRSVEAHLDSFRSKIAAALPWQPMLINFHSGADSWRISDMIRFHREAARIAADCPVPIVHETHRGRCLYSPWMTREIIEAVPDIELAADFSHWVCVAERCPDDQIDIIRMAAARTRHIHARVGYSQGPQVPDPRAPEYAQELAAHERWWDLCWAAMRSRGLTEAPLTPEFGPPPYLHTLPHTQAPVADLWDICTWQAHRQRERFGRG